MVDVYSQSVRKKSSDEAITQFLTYHPKVKSFSIRQLQVSQSVSGLVSQLVIKSVCCSMKQGDNLTVCPQMANKAAVSHQLVTQKIGQ